jgi:polyhydroxyalkanoate synthesis regulator protein
MTNTDSGLFKITIEILNSDKKAYFYINGIDEMLEGEPFNSRVVDAKTGEETTIKKEVLKQLKSEKENSQTS